MRRNIPGTVPIHPLVRDRGAIATAMPARAVGIRFRQ